jgi:PhnB protein
VARLSTGGEKILRVLVKGEVTCHRWEAMSVSHIPAGYHSVTPSLTARDAKNAIDFYHRAFGAEVKFKLEEPSGKVAHAEIQIGDSRVMISDEYPDYGASAPEIGKGGTFMIYVADVDAAFAQAVAAGATPVQEPADMFWGDRTAKVNDPIGYRWTLASHVRDVSREEMEAAMKA